MGTGECHIWQAMALETQRCDGFVELKLDAHCDWENIDGGKDKVGFERQVVEELLVE